MENEWARLHRLYDPEDLVRDRETNGDARREQGNGQGQSPRLKEQDFYRRIDEADNQRDLENW